MRLVCYEANGGVKRLGALTDRGVIKLEDAARSLGVPAESFANIDSFLSAGEPALIQAQKLIQGAPQSALLPISSVVLRAPVPRPGKIVAVGLNYRDHSIESGAKEPPKTPMIFAKFTTSIAGPGDAIVIPPGDPQVDYEAELAVVIGKRGKAISSANAFQVRGGLYAFE